MIANASPPLSLTILRQGERLFVDLAEMGTLIPRGEMRVEDAFLREAAEELRVLAMPGFNHTGSSAEAASGATHRRLQRLGDVIFSHLLPESAQNRLRAAAPGNLYLRLDEQLLAVPWELAYDGQDFLATKFRVGRQVITSQPLPGAGTMRTADGPLKVLLIADPTESLPQAAAEVEQLCALLEDIPGVEVTLVGGKNVRKLSLLAAVQEHTVVHFAGHSVYDPRSPGESGWRLQEGILMARELGKLTRPPQLLFSNSCQAGATGGWAGQSPEAEHGFGLGSTFLLAGVPNYLGPCWVVEDGESVEFALAFYRCVATGQSVGAALLHARQVGMREQGRENLTWASYVLYGDPALALLSTTNAHSLPVGSAIASSQPVGVLQRKLAAILSADVKGYSRLMGEDEEATIHTLTAYRTVMSTRIQQHRGRVVDSPGDNLLAEFASVVDAVRCAVEIQHALKEKNAELSPQRQMQFRIGINLGDVIVEGERLYGDGVNIAARLESLAVPGGICVSGTVYDHVENKLALNYDYQGEQTVKNIAKPVRTYRVVMDEAAATLAEQAVRRSFDSAQDRRTQHERIPTPVTLSPLRLGSGQASTSSGQALSQSAGGQKRRAGFARRKGALGAVAGLVLIAGAIITVRHLVLPTPNTQHPAPNTQPLPLPDKPSIVVLPFDNMSKDPEQDYFSNGLTEVLTSDLSRISSLFVIARNTAFTYQGKPVNIQAVGQELGVRYVLEGSVQKAGEHIRIVTQLIDTTTGHHLWSQRYDRPLQDIFALQDEIVQKIVTTLKLQLTLQEQGHVVHKHTDNLAAYDAVLRGQEYYWRTTQEANIQGRQMLEKAIALDPQYAEAYASLGWTYWIEWILGWSADPQIMERALALAQQALALNDSLPTAHSLLSIVYAQKQQYDQALAEGERAIALDPNHADSYALQAEMLNIAGRPEEALQSGEQAMRLNPRCPPWYLYQVGWAYRMTGRYAEAIATLKEVISRNPNFPGAHLVLASSYLGQWIAQQSPAAQTLAPAVAAGQRALALHDSLHWNHLVLGSISLCQQQYDQALEKMERAVALAPTEAWSFAALAMVLSHMGRTEDALAAAAQALRLKPLIADDHLASVGSAYAVAGRPEEAIAPLQRYLSRYPNILGVHLTLAAVYSELGKEAEAHAEATEVLRLNPNFSLEVHKERMPIKDPAVLERHMAALRKAGLK